MSRYTSILLIVLLLFLTSCSSVERSNDTAPAQASPTGEAEEADVPKRELVSSYENLKGKTDEQVLVCRVINIKNISLEKAVDTISRVMPNMISVKNDDSSSIILRGELKDIDEAQKIIGALDKKVPQIFIEGRIIEISQSGLSDIGIVWGREQGSFKFSVDRNTGGISQADSIVGTLDMLVASGKARILANPKITALDGKEAEINIGSRIPYAVPAGSSSSSNQWTIQYIDAGVNLRIISNIEADGMIVSTIKPEVSNVSEWRTTAAGEFPVISTRNASVTVRMHDGETLVIGGLINESDRENVSGIAYLSDIPVLGRIFQKRVTEKTNTDVVFLITPNLMP